MAIFVKDPRGWDELTRSPNGAFGRYMAGQGRLLVTLAKAQVGVDEDDLRPSIGMNINYRSPIGILVRVGSDNDVAYMHHEGTDAHEIRPRRAKALRFVQGGMIRYATRVWHPGTQPNRYLTDNLPKVVDTRM